jgi:hypothetical protein
MRLSMLRIYFTQKSWILGLSIRGVINLTESVIVMVFNTDLGSISTAFLKPISLEVVPTFLYEDVHSVFQYIEIIPPNGWQRCIVWEREMLT